MHNEPTTTTSTILLPDRIYYLVLLQTFRGLVAF